MKIPGHVSNDDLKKVLTSQRRANLFYYKEEYAVAAKTLLDRLHEHGFALRIPFGQCSPTTTRLQYYQGVKYLLDYLDPDEKYKKLYAQTKCVMREDHIELIKKKITPSPLLEATAVVPWKEEFENFLETAQPNQKFYKDNLVLSDEELAWIDGQLSTLIKPDGSPIFFGEIKADHILLIKDS